MSKLFRAFISTICIIQLIGLIGYGEEDKGDLLDRLIKRSGLYEQVNQYPALISAGIDQAHQQKQNMSSEDVALAKIQVKTWFDPEKLREDIRQFLNQGLTADDIIRTLEWLESPLGEKITAIEEAATTPQAHDEIRNQMETLLEEGRRLELARELEKCLHVTEASVNMIKNVQIVMTAAIMANASKDQQVSIDQIVMIVQQNTQNLFDLYYPQVLASLVYTYQGLSDSEFEKYITFVNSDVGKRYYAAVLDAIDAAVVNASSKFAATISKEVTDN
jgi:hypothetical protein